ncbi:cyclopropane-fatty-acyl-phospholipid synthase [Diplogelasinospora grovesii]|uniref:Cyclopropane-fatty-acyl-phospholipid synthase n=1 Tax=Diplogelasinospora grovesii TaxID=303347 RepID=A0AAN6S954_9PEZI|nr:cyclopropane-fatty-acyl-phospholipid synthase [Diplogelasinospora grovesii]
MNTDAVLDTVLDSGYLPHAVIRMGIRRQFAQRLAEISSPFPSLALERKMAFVEELRDRPIAIETAAANKQHYEVGTGIMQAQLGKHLKYSCSRFPTGRETVSEAEEITLAEYAEKMTIEDGMTILDIGCGWGSAVLYFAAKFPNSRVVGFSNSKTQKVYIDDTAKERGLENVEVITGDAADYEFEHGVFDRVISVEMMEHVKNYEALLAKVARAMKPGGRFFVQVFCHKDTPYHFEEGWMTRTFFTGGTMPSSDLLLYFQKDLNVVNHWWINGRHYSQTLESWYTNMKKNKAQAWPHLVATYGEENAYAWWQRWQIFCMACSEMFAYGGGEVWGVMHCLFEKPATPSKGL